MADAYRGASEFTLKSRGSSANPSHASMPLTLFLFVALAIGAIAGLFLVDYVTRPDDSAVTKAQAVPTVRNP